MAVRGLLKKGQYLDSVSLMTLSRKILQLPNVTDCAAVLGTTENRAILEKSGLFVREFQQSSDTDLLIAINIGREDKPDQVIALVETILLDLSKPKATAGEPDPSSIESASSRLEGANLILISVAGRYAADLAMKALHTGLHVMLFSDNVSLESEIKLKKYAIERGLMVMGPDCGTAIINGIPLAFANAVNRGDIGIVAASGTGLQEVSCLISNNGAGISQAIGTGGRDVKKEIGGLMFLEG